MKNIISKSLIVPALAVMMGAGFTACSKLDEKLFESRSVADASTGTSTADLAGVYNQLNQMAASQENWFALQEHSTDEFMGPTRGTDWDDFGTWRKLHLHSWDGAHNQVYATWNGMNGALYAATLVAEKASGAEKAQGQFLRAFFAYQVMDIFGQVPYRAAADGPDVIPKVYSRKEAFDFIMTDLDAAIAALPSYNTNADRQKATKEAAQFLKAKMLLNKAVYTADPTKPAGPYTFAAADMNAVISLVNTITATNKFAISPNYWDNFKWDNGTVSSEIIFSRNNANGVNLQWMTCQGFHYNQTPSGWNGFTTLSDFYNTFEANDTRRGVALPGYTDKLGNRTGFLVGLQQGLRNGTIQNLTDRSGSPLVFTPEVSLFYSTETKGIRVVKYPLHPDKLNFDSPNDFVFMRFADLRLMKAEAILRGGTDAQTPLAIVNQIRDSRGVTAMSSINLTQLLAERGRELYLEAWRRNDLIRYEKFNEPVQERAQKSDASRVVYPIPIQAVSTNPNLKQNFGY